RGWAPERREIAGRDLEDVDAPRLSARPDVGTLVVVRESGREVVERGQSLAVGEEHRRRDEVVRRGVAGVPLVEADELSRFLVGQGLDERRIYGAEDGRRPANA